MSDHDHTPMNRRHFLRTAAALTGSVALLGSSGRWQPTAAAGESGTAHWTFLSDTHIPADVENNYRGFYPYRNLEKIAPRIADDGSEGLIITGDLAR